MEGGDIGLEASGEFMTKYDALATFPLDNWGWHVKPYVLSDTDANIALPSFRVASQIVRQIAGGDESQIWPPTDTRRRRR